MADLIRPRVQMITKDGECQIHITLELNVNVNGNSVNSIDVEKEEVEKKEEKPEWVVPTFNSSEKIKFGKKG